MTKTEYKQIQESFKPVKTFDEVQKINHDIDEINSILSINAEHIDNRLFYLLYKSAYGTNYFYLQCTFRWLNE